LLRPYAVVTEGELVYDPNSKRAPLSLRRRVEYQGFELEREVEAVDEFPPELAAKARHVLAEALARGEARHPGARSNQDAIESIRETYRRSGGTTPKLGLAELTAHYERQLAQVNSIDDFRHTTVRLDPDEFVPRDVRERYAALPSSTMVRDRDVEIHYDVEETPDGLEAVARLRLPEKLARTLNDQELPKLDRPLRFIVTRGARGAARAKTLEELQEELDRPFTEKEIAEIERNADEHRRERHERKRERRTRDSGEKLKEHRKLGDAAGDGRRKAKGPGGRFRPPGKPRGGRRRRG
jgi:ATP-dependent helicase HrpA